MFTHKRTCAVPSLTQTHVHTTLVPNNLKVLKILLEEGKGAIGQEKVVKKWLESDIAKCIQCGNVTGKHSYVDKMY